MFEIAFLIIIIWLVLGAIAAFVFNRQWVRVRTDWHLQEVTRDPEEEDHQPTTHDAGGLREWLRKAGFRSRYAPAYFMAAVVFAIMLGLFTFTIFTATGFQKQAMESAAKLPGGMGDLITPILAAMPWVILAVTVMVPVLVVRSVRRRRVEMFEQDLPVALEMLATLSEAGLAFDASLARILQSMQQDRPLVQEFRIFRMESMSGSPRIGCFRRLSRRVDVANFNVFVAAVVQAEQIGASLAQVLRLQADDMRNRRRERAMEFTMSRPTKLLVPMVICFMPGILVWALGPVFFELIRFLETMIRSA